MTDASIAQSEPVLVAIDIAKVRHEVLIAVPARPDRIDETCSDMCGDQTG